MKSKRIPYRLLFVAGLGLLLGSAIAISAQAGHPLSKRNPATWHKSKAGKIWESNREITHKLRSKDEACPLEPALVTASVSIPSAVFTKLPDVLLANHPRSPPVSIEV
jgi:hypothetical protein